MYTESRLIVISTLHFSIKKEASNKSKRKKEFCFLAKLLDLLVFRKNWIHFKLNAVLLYQ
jgi:hypothetical protein